MLASRSYSTDEARDHEAIGRRLTYANVVSTLALFLVLTGGAAFAAHRYLTKKSVGTPQLKSNAVTTAKIKANAITTRKIKRIAVSSDKLKEDAVTTEKLADGAVDAEKIDLDRRALRAGRRADAERWRSLTLEAELAGLPAEHLELHAGRQRDRQLRRERRGDLPREMQTAAHGRRRRLARSRDPVEPDRDEIFAAGTLERHIGSGA